MACGASLSGNVLSMIGVTLPASTSSCSSSRSSLRAIVTNVHRLHSRELLLVDRVERGEVSQVDEVDKARNDVVDRCSGSLEHGLDVVEGLLGLFDQIVADHLVRVRIEAALAGQEDPLTDRHTG